MPKKSNLKPSSFVLDIFIWTLHFLGMTTVIIVQEFFFTYIETEWFNVTDV